MLVMPPRTPEQRGQQHRRSVLRGSLDGRVASARPVRERPQVWAQVGPVALPPTPWIWTSPSSTSLEELQSTLVRSAPDAWRLYTDPPVGGGVHRGRNDSLVVVPGNTYTAGLWMRLVTAMPAPECYLEVLHADGSTTGTVGPVIPTTSAWTEISISFTVPAGSTTARLVLQSSSGAFGTAMNIVVDDEYVL